MKYRLTTWFTGPEDLAHFSVKLSHWVMSELRSCILRPRSEKLGPTPTNLVRSLAPGNEPMGDVSFRGTRNGAPVVGRVTVANPLWHATEIGTFECEFSLRPVWTNQGAFASGDDVEAFLAGAASATSSVLGQVEADDMPDDISESRYATFQSLPRFVPVSIEWLTVVRGDLASELGWRDLPLRNGVSWRGDYLALRAGDLPFSYSSVDSVSCLRNLEQYVRLAELHQVRAVQRA